MNVYFKCFIILSIYSQSVALRQSVLRLYWNDTEIFRNNFSRVAALFLALFPIAFLMQDRMIRKGGK